VSWIPENTGGYFPNSANKYIAIPGLCLEPDRIVVVRGKGAVFPDSYDGGSIWDPNGVMLRYWSMCNNNEGTPYPVVACQADQFTQLDDQGYYTYVLSEPESGRGNMTGAPSWLPADATWLPWGSRTTPNILIFRNMLPDASFSHSVQVAIQAVCSRQSARCPTISRGDCQGGRMCSQGDGRILSASGLLQ
jgi:hypothetical protein